MRDLIVASDCGQLLIGVAADAFVAANPEFDGAVLAWTALNYGLASATLETNQSATLIGGAGLSGDYFRYLTKGRTFAGRAPLAKGATMLQGLDVLYNLVGCYQSISSG